MKKHVWRKGTKKDAVVSIMFAFTLGAFFLGLGFLLLFKTNIVFGILVISLGTFLFCYLGKTFVKYILFDEPYEYYIQVKCFPAHFKGSQVGLPNRFCDLTNEQNKYLERGEFPPVEGDVSTSYTDTSAVNRKINDRNSSGGDLMLNEKNFKKFYIICIVVSVVMLLQFFLPFIYFAFTHLSNPDLPLNIKVFLICFGLIFFLGILGMIFMFVRLIITKQNENKDENKNRKFDKEIYQTYDDEDPFKDYYNKK